MLPKLLGSSFPCSNFDVPLNLDAEFLLSPERAGTPERVRNDRDSKRSLSGICGKDEEIT